MKKCILGILMIVYSLASYGQEENKFSIGMDANYLYHHLDKDMNNNFNYGFSLLMSENIARIKVSFGLNYSTFNTYYTAKPTNNSASYLEKEEYEVQYLNFPLLVYFRNNSEKLSNVNPYIGIIVSKAINYDMVSYYLNTPPVYNNDIYMHQTLGFTFRIGVNVSKPICQHIVLNTAIFSDFKLVTNSVSRSHGFGELPDSGITFGLKIGVDYCL